MKSVSIDITRYVTQEILIELSTILSPEDLEIMSKSWKSPIQDMQWRIQHGIYLQYLKNESI
jgi:hypothetical protein